MSAKSLLRECLDAIPDFSDGALEMLLQAIQVEKKRRAKQRAK